MLYKYKQLLENYNNSNIYGTYYHGSKINNLKYLEPQLDKRLGITGVFISKDKHHPMAFSLIPNSYKTSVNTTTKNGKFIKGVITTSEDLNDIGYLYTVTINKDNINYLKPYKKESYYSTNRLKVDKMEIVKKEDLIKLGWTINNITTYIFGEEHNNSNSVKDIQRQIIDIQPDIILSELWWEDKPFFKKYLPNTKVLPLEPDNKNYKNMSLNDSFQIREKYMLNTIEKYYNSSNICVIVGDTHLRKTNNKEIKTNSPIYEWSKNKTDVKIIRSKNNEIN